MRAILRQVVAIMLLVAPVSGCALFEQRHHAAAQATKVDLKTAGRRELQRLPGPTGADVDRIVKNRPYAKKHELLDRGILDQRKFDAIRDDVVVSQAAK
jgi:DNA uptake protein ComE-like DNA-binding protein